MTRLPWQHNRNRTKSGGEKYHFGPPQEWFSRNTSEPSRQALTDLVRTHKREKSDESTSNSARSRSTTVTSMDWRKGRSRAGSTSDDGWTSPSGNQYGQEGSIYSALERTEGTTRGLLAKSSFILKRTGSKMSLSSAGSNSTMGLTSPQRAHTANASTLGRDDIRSKISAPFDFQHVTHTEQTQFPGLKRIEESELAHQFNAITTDQPTAVGLRGIPTSDIPSNDTGEQVFASEPVDAVPVDSLPRLPTTPPRPLPPPKDDSSLQTTPHSKNTTTTPLTSTATDACGEQTRTLPTIDISTSFSDLVASSAVGAPSPQPDSISTSDLDAKPLPQLPIIHAVTTEDNTARAMIAVPLPTPPGTTSPSSDSGYFNKTAHQRQKSSIVLPRHFSLYPSVKTSMPDLLSTNHIASNPRPFPRHRSDMALSSYLRDSQVAGSTRTSMSFAAVDTMNWEEAVDEAWNEVGDVEDLGVSQSQQTSFDSSLGDSFQQTKSSTPLLMMAASDHSSAGGSAKTSPSLSTDPRQSSSLSADNDPRKNSLTGLGISSIPSNGASASLSRPASQNLSNKRSSLYNPNAALTRSSSQESIILSIASSIIGTQRSSNSSIAAEDLPSMSRIQEDTIEESLEEESSQLSLGDSQRSRTQRPDSGCLPSHFMNVSHSSHVTQNDQRQKEIPPLPTTANHKHSKSASKIVVHDRKSSIPGPEGPRTTRKRSNTAGSRPRQSVRISYSLFPTSNQTPLPAAVTS